MNKIKFLFVLLGMCLAINGVAQSNLDIKFMGISLDMNKREFADSLLVKRPDIKVNDDSTSFKGDFYIFKNIDFFVKADSDGYMECVEITFVEDDNRQIKRYINDLTLKYGEPKKGKDTAIWESKGNEIHMFKIELVGLYNFKYYSKKALRKKEQERKEKIDDI